MSLCNLDLHCRVVRLSYDFVRSLSFYLFIYLLPTCILYYKMSCTVHCIWLMVTEMKTEDRVHNTS